jgi:formate-dependent phosphoribosylglycinamide formyltransferase (GAR transformylase)
MIKSLLVDTNRGAYTVYKALCSLGHEVTVIGSNPEAPLAKISSHFIHLDYSDPVLLGDLIEYNKYKSLIPGCTDVSYKACAEVNQGRFPGIDSVEATRAINDKSEFRAVAARFGIPVPKVLVFKEALHCDAVIVKPVDAFSGLGISIVKNPTRESLQLAYAAACEVSKTRTALIEEYVTGQLYSHSAFMQSGEVVADFVVREDCTTNPFAVDTSKVVFDFPKKLRESLKSDASKLFNGLGLEDGLIHSQFILSGDHYWIIEVTRRCPGDLYALLIEMSTGYPYGASYAASFLGEAPLSQAAGTLEKHIIRHTATSKDGASLWGLSFNKPVNLKFFVPLATAGDFIKSSPYGRAGLFFLEAQSYKEQQSLYESLLSGSLYRFNYT